MGQGKHAAGYYAVRLGLEDLFLKSKTFFSPIFIVEVEFMGIFFVWNLFKFQTIDFIPFIFIYLSCRQNMKYPAHTVCNKTQLVLWVGGNKSLCDVKHQNRNWNSLDIADNF